MDSFCENCAKVEPRQDWLDTLASPRPVPFWLHFRNFLKSYDFEMRFKDFIKLNEIGIKVYNTCCSLRCNPRAVQWSFAKRQNSLCKLKSLHTVFVFSRLAHWVLPTPSFWFLRSRSEVLGIFDSCEFSDNVVYSGKVRYFDNMPVCDPTFVL